MKKKEKAVYCPLCFGFIFLKAEKRLLSKFKTQTTRLICQAELK